MSKQDQTAEEILKAIAEGSTIESIKVKLGLDSHDWYRYSGKAYKLFFDAAKKERKEFETRRNVSTTTVNEVKQILKINNTLADYGLSIPTISNMGDLIRLKGYLKSVIVDEMKLIEAVGAITMHPKYRVQQKLGRIKVLNHFKMFTKLIDAATISYYRTNFVSCYLTLLPVIEGIIIRWMGYNEVSEKPEFEEIRNFFKNSHVRQPCPSNIMFHDIFTKACNKILNEHFYKPTSKGNSYANFNRHVASHILNDGEFATRDNCIRLFILIDTMTEIFVYESRGPDARFNLKNVDTNSEVKIFAELIIENVRDSAEHKLLGTSRKDIIV